MAGNHPHRISFPEIRSLIRRYGGGKGVVPFLRQGIVILYPVSTIVTHILKVGTPYIIEETRIGLIRRGTGVVTINMIDYAVRANTFIYLSKGSIVQPQQMSSDIEICALMVSEERLANNVLGGAAAATRVIPSYLVVEATEEEASHVDTLFALVASLLRTTPCPNGAINALLQALTCYYMDIHQRQESATAGVRSHSKEMFDRFIALLNQHCKEQHTMAFYADKLCVTPRYLGVVVKTTSGVTAKEWIDRALTTAAKVLLRHSDRQIQQIADELHFANASFFCKFFRRMTGITPQKYRDS